MKSSWEAIQVKNIIKNVRSLGVFKIFFLHQDQAKAEGKIQRDQDMEIEKDNLWSVRQADLLHNTIK